MGIICRPLTRDRPNISLQTQMQSFFCLFEHIYLSDPDRKSPSCGSLVRLRPSTALTFFGIMQKRIIYGYNVWIAALDN